MIKYFFSSSINQKTISDILAEFRRLIRQKIKNYSFDLYNQRASLNFLRMLFWRENWRESGCKFDAKIREKLTRKFA